MVTGDEECARCGHLRAVHGAPRAKRGMGCISTVKTDSARHGCSCPGFEGQSEFLTPGENPTLTIEALKEVMVTLCDAPVPLITEGELPSVLPGVEDSSLALGDRIEFRNALVRRMVAVGERDPNDRFDMRSHRRTWVQGEYKDWRVGFIAGKRTLQNGEYVYGGYEEQSYLTDIEYVQAYLITYDMRQKPVFVLEEDIRKAQ